MNKQELIAEIKKQATERKSNLYQSCKFQLEDYHETQRTMRRL